MVRFGFGMGDKTTTKTAVAQKEFDRLLKVCHKSLLRFEQQSQETLRLIVLVEQNPESSELRNALQFQVRREGRALAVYRGRVRKLAVIAVDTIPE